MELTFACPQCQTVDRVASIATATDVTCPSCAYSRAVDPASFPEGQLCACGYCATEDLYIQKDFPQMLGLTIVIVGFVVSSVFWYYERPLITYAILLGSALLDLVLYYRVPEVTICYRCLGQYRGEGSNPGGTRFAPFDLAVGERYRQERLRIEQLRLRPSAADPVPPT